MHIAAVLTEEYYLPLHCAYIHCLVSVNAQKMMIFSGYWRKWSPLLVNIHHLRQYNKIGDIILRATFCIFKKTYKCKWLNIINM